MTDRLQINLNNNTINFKVQHAVLNLTQIHRFRNTAKAYERVWKEWKIWCEKHKYDDGDIVHESKLIRFLQNEVINRFLKNSFKKRKHKKEELINDFVIVAKLATKNLNVEKMIDERTLQYQNVRDYKTELINLYKYQHNWNFNHHLNSEAEAFLKSFMNVQQHTQYQKKKNCHDDRERDIITNDYNISEFRRIIDFFWKHFENDKNFVVDFFLKFNLNFLINHFLFLRDESRRRAKFLNLQLLYLKNEDFESTSCLFYVMNNDKINQNNRIEYADFLRHRDLRLYLINVMINYFVWRWHQFDEQFSFFKVNKN